MNERCVNKNYKGRCQVKSRTDELCKSSDLCLDFESDTNHHQIFDDDKWFWKSSMHLLSYAFDALSQFEEGKFHSTKGDIHGRARRKMGHYHFIPRGVNNLLPMLIYGRKYLSSIAGIQNPKFLDCGCGVGNVVILAQFAGFDAYGIEYDTVTLARGRRLLKQFRIDPNKLMKGDILEYKKYHEYNMLYGFCPMSNPVMEREFEAKLRLDMKVGALICGLSCPSGCTKIDKEHVYFKHLALANHTNYYHSIKIAPPKTE